MRYTTSVTQKGQVTIPKNLREKLKINVYGKVIVEAEKGYVKVSPTKDIVDLAGMLSGKIKIKKDILEGREAMETSYGRV